MTKNQLNRLTELATEMLEIISGKGAGKKRRREACTDDIRAIQRAVIEHYKLPPDSMESTIKTAFVARGRMLAMYLCRKLTTHSTSIIAEAFRHDMCHSTIIIGANSIADQISVDAKFAAEVESLADACRAEIGKLGLSNDAEGGVVV